MAPVHAWPDGCGAKSEFLARSTRSYHSRGLLWGPSLSSGSSSSRTKPWNRPAEHFHAGGSMFVGSADPAIAVALDLATWTGITASEPIGGRSLPPRELQPAWSLWPGCLDNLGQLDQASHRLPHTLHAHLVRCRPFSSRVTRPDRPAQVRPKRTTTNGDHLVGQVEGMDGNDGRFLSPDPITPYSDGCTHLIFECVDVPGNDCSAAIQDCL